jgi:hypothetical protein
MELIGSELVVKSEAANSGYECVNSGMSLSDRGKDETENGTVKKN